MQPPWTTVVRKSPGSLKALIMKRLQVDIGHFLKYMEAKTNRHVTVPLDREFRHLEPYRASLFICSMDAKGGISPDFKYYPSQTYICR